MSGLRARCFLQPLTAIRFSGFAPAADFFADLVGRLAVRFEACVDAILIVPVTLCNAVCSTRLTAVAARLRSTVPAELLAVVSATLLAALPTAVLHAQDDADDDLWNFDDEEVADPTLLELAGDQALDITLFAAFATLAMVSFLRKSIPLKYATLIVSVVYMGAMKSQLMSVVNIFGALTANLPIFSYSMAWYAFAVFTVVTTVLWGRVYCGRICAFGALTQLIDAVVPRRFQFEIPVWLERRASMIKYGILFGAIAYFLATREITFYRYIEPFWIFTFEASTALWIGVGLLLVASIFVRNLYCRFLCPLGAALGIMSKLTIFRIKRWSECSTCALCEKKCDWGAIQQRRIVMTECVRCDECEILYDSKTRCPHWLLVAKRARMADRTNQADQSRSRPA